MPDLVVCVRSAPLTANLAIGQALDKSRIGWIYSICDGFHDDITSDYIPLDGRNTGEGYEPILNDYLTEVFKNIEQSDFFCLSNLFINHYYSLGFAGGHSSSLTFTEMHVFYKE